LFFYIFQELTEVELQQFYEMVAQRAENLPTAYILGLAPFYKSEFIVNSSVLIPRPETEELVETVLKNVPLAKNYKIIDFGCGSGCIALSLLKEKINSTALFVDLSSAALDVARCNAKKLDLLDRSYFLNKSVEDITNEDLKAVFHSSVDVVVANPPYISTQSCAVGESVIKYEPHLALFGGEKGWEKYEGWAQKAYDFLQPNGLFACEIGYDQKEVLKELFTQSFLWLDMQFYQDLSGRDRIVTLKKGNN
ncbi:MAG: peptide chain release factor N(5)-glutamine methyltransferase, partial [Bdellovibrionales bacterium]|nr:peptide chain release factor N(5)-glutamine methyltransferase [Bdellovibrionales bacterium]